MHLAVLTRTSIILTAHVNTCFIIYESTLFSYRKQVFAEEGQVWLIQNQNNIYSLKQNGKSDFQEYFWSNYKERKVGRGTYFFLIFRRFNKFLPQFVTVIFLFLWTSSIIFKYRMLALECIQNVSMNPFFFFSYFKFLGKFQNHDSKGKGLFWRRKWYWKSKLEKINSKAHPCRFDNNIFNKKKKINFRQFMTEKDICNFILAVIE